MHKILLSTIIGTVLLGAILSVAQIWMYVLDWGDFVKLLATMGIIIVVAGFLLVVGIDFGEHKKLKDDNYID